MYYIITLCLHYLNTIVVYFNFNVIYTFLDIMANISMNRHQFPNEEDFEGAMTALIRLQETYHIDTSTIAQGKLGSNKGLPMNSKL